MFGGSDSGIMMPLTSLHIHSYECFGSIYVFEPCMCLVPGEVRGGGVISLESQIVVNYYVGAGN